MPDKPVKREYWIQIENRWWDMAPHNIDRMTGLTIQERVGKPPEKKTLIQLDLDSEGKPQECESRDQQMYLPVEALILRRYCKPKKDDQSDAWTRPYDRKINPWDLNEPDPKTTMGTIPGPTIECNVGDRVIVHFRNMDFRRKKESDKNQNEYLPIRDRVHSLHPHGIAFQPIYGGAYPFSPHDTTQRIDGQRVRRDDPVRPDETALWHAVREETEFKRGDRVPPGATFTYSWHTSDWPSTAGVWLYHDHSVKDHHNILLGALGILVIHNPADEDDVFIDWDEEQEGVLEEVRYRAKQNLPPVDSDKDPWNGALTFQKAIGDKEKEFYVNPPKRALYLQLYHEMTYQEKAGEVKTIMAINGRQYLGNTPTLIGGTETKMRFGLVAMGNTFHTFHLHGHRWVIPGPSGGKVGGAVPYSYLGGRPGSPTGMQVSPLNQAVSQFEDTRVFGPANSFSFTINPKSFMGPLHNDNFARGEWHMHCHTLHHMMHGMMGSLLIIKNNETVTRLERGITKFPDELDGNETE